MTTKTKKIIAKKELINKLLILFIFILFISFPAFANGGNIFNGQWGWEDEHSLFTVDLWQDSDILRGKYWAVAMDGNKIDCGTGDERDINIFGSVNGNVAEVFFFSYYGRGMGDPGSCMGKARLILNGDQIQWTITESPTTFYWCPQEALLEKESDKEIKQ
tara:strand:+ start:184 stop:666 length:483 start_codon:yes stop_codon:yes gene_type:complete